MAYGIQRTTWGGASRTAVWTLLACLIFTQTCSGWGGAHPKITAAAFGALPAWQQERWAGEREAMISRYCRYPDWGRSSPEASPYLYIAKSGRFFHYFPVGDNAADYTAFIEGATFYVRTIVDKLKQGADGEAAKFAGAFAHVLEDLGHPMGHALEGINGFSWTVLDELFTPVDATWNRAPQSIIALDDASDFVVILDQHAPRLLGTTPEEAAFRLYQRGCRMRQFARKCLPAALAAAYADDRGGAVKAVIPAAVENARLVADAFYTCLAMAAGRFPADQIEALRTLDLTELVPVEAPILIGVPYRFSPLAYGCSVDSRRKPAPLMVRVREAGQEIERTFDKGIGTGCATFGYLVPPGVFSEFRCVAGIHPRLSNEREKEPGRLRLKVLLDDRVVFDSGILEPGSVGARVTVPLVGGGKLTFVSEDESTIRNNRGNQAVWAEPVLVRQE